jgi:hypothetical protein|tara:strand:- start:672 stop:1115 length:444 start_codon:yes stop_codon:yes gene_type:complete
MATAVSYTADEFKKMMDDVEKNDAGKRKELSDYLKCVSNNPNRFNALTDVITKDGHDLDGECCKRIDPKIISEVAQKVMRKIVFGNMKVNGKEGQWSCGSMGSRWFDYEDERLDHCRIAFYSKKFNGEYLSRLNKPYAIIMTMEVAN